MLRLNYLTFVLTALLVGGLPVWAQQLEEEDLPEPEIWEEVIPSFVEAETIFNSRNQPDSLALFDDFLRQVDDTRAFEEPPEEIYEAMIKAAGGQDD